ncbi:hypothetical protein CR513_10365, partial [Mucuna pruriens]
MCSVSTPSNKCGKRQSIDGQARHLISNKRRSRHLKGGKRSWRIRQFEDGELADGVNIACEAARC